jgi:hypothetical protein
MAILFLAGASHEATRCAIMASINPEVLDTLRKITWASRNYNIYARVLITMSALLIGILLLSATVIYSNKQNIYIWNSGTMIGLVIGVSLTFFNRGMAIKSV